jgi:hypothetical protein
MKKTNLTHGIAAEVRKAHACHFTPTPTDTPATDKVRVPFANTYGMSLWLLIVEVKLTIP